MEVIAELVCMENEVVVEVITEQHLKFLFGETLAQEFLHWRSLNNRSVLRLVHISPFALNAWPLALALNMFASMCSVSMPCIKG